MSWVEDDQLPEVRGLLGLKMGVELWKGSVQVQGGPRVSRQVESGQETSPEMEKVGPSYLGRQDAIGQDWAAQERHVGGGAHQALPWYRCLCWLSLMSPP